MESLNASSKDQTPVKSDEDDIDDEDLDETLSERLWGLTEMFPEGVRNATHTAVTGTCQGIKGLYSFARVATWLFFSSSVLLFAPLIFEIERAQMEDMQRSQQKQVLLGPNSAMAGGMSMPPPVQR
ncbi:mitochondrial import receptor subunit TOM22 homolog isoform X2 [Anabrus simplex]